MESHEKYQTREFGFSETFIREGSRNLLVLFLFLLFFGVVFSLYVSKFSIEGALFAVGVILLIFGVIMAIEMPLINWRLRKLKLFIDEDKIVKQCGRKQQIYLWKDIAKIKTFQNKNGGVAQIKIYPKERKMAMYLHGFGQMETIANLVKERTFDNALHQEKRYKLDWQNPFVSLLVAGVPTSPRASLAVSTCYR